MCCSNFFVFPFFFPRSFPRLSFIFSLFRAVDCLLNRTRVSDVVDKGTGTPTVEDTGRIQIWDRLRNASQKHLSHLLWEPAKQVRAMT